MTFGEDASHARSGSLLRVTASLRNLAVAALRLPATNLAAALGHTGRDPGPAACLHGLAYR